MASSDPDEERPESVLVDCIENPAGARERLPRIVGMLDDDDRRTRQYGAFACCLLADELDDDVREYVVRRLTDRLGGENVSLELTAALDYVSNRHADQVEEVLEEIDDGADGEMPLARVGSFTRDHYYGSEPEREGVGRTQVAGDEDGEDPRRAYADRESEEREQTERERDRETDDGGSDEGGEESAGGEGGAADATEEEGATVEQRTEVSSIAARSQFDKLHILEARDRGRYADTYEALIGQGGEEQAVQLRLLNRPDDRGAWVEFEQQVGEALFRWAAVADHEHVVTVLDWDVEPRPWLATTFTGNSLADRERPPIDRAVGDAVNLADAVSHLHKAGVVHGGIDPENVAYPGAMLASDGQIPPMLNNVGLMNAFRYHFEPATCLDPRYAAPEYYDDGYGRIDHATDIYQLGAVLYRLLTGRAPYRGEIATVREQVLDRQPTPPSNLVDEIPPAVDDVLRKAMAKQKLTRYETVEHFQQELDGVRGETDG